MTNLNNLEKKMTEAEQKKGAGYYLVIKQSYENPDEFYTMDGELFTGDREANNILTIVYDKNWRGDNGEN